MRSEAKTVEAYLAELPEERREIVSRVREFVLDALPDGYEETMNWGMISYEIPLERYPDTYNGQPLNPVALASQKRHVGLYLMAPYMDPELQAELEKGYEDAGKRLDMGKSCIRFKQFDDLAVEPVRQVISSVDPARFIEMYEQSRRR